MDSRVIIFLTRITFPYYWLFQAVEMAHLGSNWPTRIKKIKSREKEHPQAFQGFKLPLPLLFPFLTVSLK